MSKLLLVALLFSSNASQRQPNQQWHAAMFRGLIVGKSRRADMVRRLGQPKWTRSPESRGSDDADKETFNNYEGGGEFPGRMTVVINRRGVISRIDFYPAKLSREQAIAHFGPSYIITKYAFDPCESDEDSEPIYESPNGPLTSLEYRARGIAIAIGYQDMVTKISYVAGPIGRLRPRCQ